MPKMQAKSRDNDKQIERKSNKNSKVEFQTNPISKDENEKMVN
jgi:hypothetical protein